MRKNFGANSAMLPEPVLMIASYAEDGTPDLMNAAWGGISGNCEICMCLSPTHKSVENILAKKEFTVSMATKDTVAECDYVGLVSGNDVPNKVEAAGLHTTKAEHVDAPMIDELPMVLECKLKSYDEDSHHMFAEIVNIAADESVLDKDGNIDVAKLQPIVYDGLNHDYLLIEKKVADAFEVGKKFK